MRLILFVLTWLSMLVLMTSCEKECACLTPEACSYCQSGCCDCCNSTNQVVIRAVLPDGQHADSYCLQYEGNERKFYGDNVLIRPTKSYADLLMFNNDGETVVVHGNMATTNLEYGNDSIRYQPSPLFSLYQPQTLVKDVDTIDVYLQQRVFNYDIEIELRNNDGRVGKIIGVIVSGMSKDLDLKTNALYGTTSYRTSMKETEGIYRGRITSFGPGADKHSITIVYIQENKKYGAQQMDLTEKIKPLIKGGTVKITIDVDNTFPKIEDPSSDSSGIEVHFADWEEASNIDIKL